MVLFRDRFRLVAPSSGTKFAHALIKYRLSQMSLHRIHHPPQKAVHDARKVPLSPPRPKPIGALCPVPQLFAQFTCFPLASGWGISSITSMLGATFTFRLALLLPDSCCNFPVWSNFHFLACFAPTGFLLQLPRLEQPSPFCLRCSYWIPAAASPLGATFPFRLALLLLVFCSSFPAWSNFSQNLFASQQQETPGLQPSVSKRAKHNLIIIAIQLFHFLSPRVCIVQLQNRLSIITVHTIHDLEYEQRSYIL